MCADGRGALCGGAQGADQDPAGVCGGLRPGGVDVYHYGDEEAGEVGRGDGEG